MFNWNKKKNEKRLNTLIGTDTYKNSDYKIEKVNGAYGIKNTNSGNYVDLSSGVHEWRYGTMYTADCFSSISDVLSVFHFLHPIIEPINTRKVF